MSKKLAITVIAVSAFISTAFGVAGVVPVGMKAEWDAYWQGAMENYQFDAGNLSVDYDAPFMVDTFTIPQGRLCDTMTCTVGGWYNFIFPTEETDFLSLNSYKTWNGAHMPVYGPDSSPTIFPGYLGKNVILHKAAGDTSTATGVCRIWWKNPPRTPREVYP